MPGERPFGSRSSCRRPRSESQRARDLLNAQGAEAQRLRGRLDQLSAIEAEIRERNRIYEEVLGRFRSLIDAGRLSVSIVRGRMVINLPQDILFASGSATLGREGRETLSQIATVLGEFDDRSFQVEGHTDDVPISTTQFPSNWELSAARALSVVKLLVTEGVPPGQRLRRRLRRVSPGGYESDHRGPAPEPAHRDRHAAQLERHCRDGSRELGAYFSDSLLMALRSAREKPPQTKARIPIRVIQVAVVIHFTSRLGESRRGRGRP